MSRGRRTARRLTRLATAACVSALLLAACSDADDTADGPTRSPSPDGGAATGSASGATSTDTSAPTPGEPRVSGTVAHGLDVPWGVDFLPSGDALVTERERGDVLRLGPGGRAHRLGTVPGVVPNGEGGLLGIAVSPDFPSDHAVFVYLTAADENRIVRLTLEGGRLGHARVVLDGIPAASFHDGGRLAFGPDGMLYAGTGDAGVSSRAQDLDSLGGKILRMTPRGTVPDDNPFDGSYVFSRGHRNVQGLTFDPDGRLWASEFGQDTWDELNLVRAGGNYGWPEVEGRGGGDRFVDPKRQWPTDEASPSGAAFLDGAVYMAALRGGRLWQIPVSGPRAGRPVDFLTGDYGRLRTVVAAPDGALWVTTSNTDGRGDPDGADDRILRVPVR